MGKHDATMADLKDALESLGFSVSFHISPLEPKGEPMPTTKRTARFHIRRTKSGEYRPYLRAANGEQVGGSETYKTVQGAQRWIARLYVWVGDAALQEVVMDKRG